MSCNAVTGLGLDDVARVAIVHDIFHGDGAEERLLAQLQHAKRQGAGLAVLPELPFDKWMAHRRDTRSDADGEQAGGRRQCMLARCAQTAGLAVLGGAIVCSDANSERHNNQFSGELPGSHAVLVPKSAPAPGRRLLGGQPLWARLRMPTVRARERVRVEGGTADLLWRDATGWLANVRSSRSRAGARTQSIRAFDVRKMENGPSYHGRDVRCICDIGEPSERRGRHGGRSICSHRPKWKCHAGNNVTRRDQSGGDSPCWHSVCEEFLSWLPCLPESSLRAGLEGHTFSFTAFESEEHLIGEDPHSDDKDQFHVQVEHVSLTS